MGYYMTMHDMKMNIPKANHDRCLKAIKALAAHAWSVRGGHPFAWVRTSEFADATTLREALAAWRCVDPNQDLVNPDEFEHGDIRSLYFAGEKLGDDAQLMGAIAPYVEPGSYIEMHGEDGDRWRWYFDGESCVQQQGRTVYDDEEAILL